MTRVLALVEGQTEERFVKDILQPHLAAMGVYVYPTLLVTKRVKDGPNFKGGITNYAKFENDVRRLLQDPDALVTTIVDYYGLPPDFPGMATRAALPTSSARVVHLQNSVDAAINNARFRSFFSLHEFEAWLFASPDVIPTTMPEGQHDAFRGICAALQPEEINDRPEHAPSKRIENLYPGYKKPLHGSLAAGRIGLDTIRARCPHFNAWLTSLEALAPQ